MAKTDAPSERLTSTSPRLVATSAVNANARGSGSGRFSDRGASDRFGGTYPLVRFGVLPQQSAKLRRTTADDARSCSVAGAQHPPQPRSRNL